MTNDDLNFPKVELANVIDDDSEFIPLLTSEDEESMNQQKIPDALAILPLRNTVLFPGVVIPITVGRDKSINLIREAYKGDKIIGVVSQKDTNIEDPKFEDLKPDRNRSPPAQNAPDARRKYDHYHPG